MIKYLIDDQFTVNGKQIISFDKKIDINDLGSSYILVDGKKYKFSITHNDYWILTEITDNLIGKQVLFVN